MVDRQYVSPAVHDYRGRHRENPKPSRQIGLDRGIHIADIHASGMAADQFFERRLLERPAWCTIRSGERQDKRTPVRPGQEVQRAAASRSAAPPCQPRPDAPDDQGEAPCPLLELSA